MQSKHWLFSDQVSDKVTQTSSPGCKLSRCHLQSWWWRGNDEEVKKGIKEKGKDKRVWRAPLCCHIEKPKLDSPVSVIIIIPKLLLLLFECGPSVHNPILSLLQFPGPAGVRAFISLPVPAVTLAWLQLSLSLTAFLQIALVFLPVSWARWEAPITDCTRIQEESWNWWPTHPSLPQVGWILLLMCGGLSLPPSLPPQLSMSCIYTWALGLLPKESSPFLLVQICPFWEGRIYCSLEFL